MIDFKSMILSKLASCVCSRRKSVHQDTKINEILSFYRSPPWRADLAPGPRRPRHGQDRHHRGQPHRRRHPRGSLLLRQLKLAAAHLHTEPVLRSFSASLLHSGTYYSCLEANELHRLD